ncbi:two-component sensor histidine kinase [Hydrogenophaga crassostreae]|uniref:histidine kinase n=1 Tax=Hydrogenophaga crassostreae TaxID=1763535 RepID=A0A167GT51_9BURK|nr:ATP-binding protein [Hydrogenophaga crassostreae]AOW11754.1 two-component sensor histidine kinase [Hydrogenophaga crassostreae]OAD39845.1 two-component sensor histidine kinase [Hydrogenophaga crassostreae]
MIGRLGQRLYLRIWLAVVVAVMVLSVVVGWLWREALDRDREERDGRVAREIVLRNSVGQVVGQAPAEAVRLPGQGLEFQVVMNDGQTLYVELPRVGRSPGGVPSRRAMTGTFGFLWTLALVAVAVALGAYPIVRRLTKRLETLQKGVDRWGQGDLSTRLPEHGADEVALLSRRFNQAAERVENLLLSHKTLLANASHELRSPLARIRMGLELLGTDPVHARQRREMARSIEELDQLIDEILLASRLDMRDANDASALGPTEEVDLVGLAAEECARVGADLDIAPSASSVLVQGHARLLRRVLRNLLENARRYGQSPQAIAAGEAGEAAIRLTVALLPASPGQGADAWAEVCVEDRGPGVPPELREQIFEAFYRLPGASEREGGVGLGLALVKSIAQRHGGSVRCEERTGGGARFVVTLPAQASE